MSNDSEECGLLYDDEVRTRFENQIFPPGVVHKYLGRMTEDSSLGRYFLGVCSPNLPIELKSVNAAPMRVCDLSEDDDSTELLGISSQFTPNYKMDISAMRIQYLFSDVWGDIVAETGYTVLESDINNETNLYQPSDLFTFQPMKCDGDPIGIHLPELNALNSHICIFGITHVRTANGALYKMPNDYLANILNWALGKNNEGYSDDEGVHE